MVFDGNVETRNQSIAFVPLTTLKLGSLYTHYKLWKLSATNVDENDDGDHDDDDDENDGYDRDNHHQSRVICSNLTDKRLNADNM